MCICMVCCFFFCFYFDDFIFSSGAFFIIQHDVMLMRIINFYFYHFITLWQSVRWFQSMLHFVVYLCEHVCAHFFFFFLLFILNSDCFCFILIKKNNSNNENSCVICYHQYNCTVHQISIFNKQSDKFFVPPIKNFFNELLLQKNFFFAFNDFVCSLFCVCCCLLVQFCYIFSLFRSKIFFFFLCHHVNDCYRH